MQRLSDYLTPERIMVLPGSTRGAATVATVLHQLAILLAAGSGLEPAEVEAGLQARERLGSTGLGAGVALPHARAEIERPLAALALSPEGVPFGAPDGRPAHVIVGLLSPAEGQDHLRALRIMSRELSDPELFGDLCAARDPAAVYLRLRR